jgi:hypothetical protein
MNKNIEKLKDVRDTDHHGMCHMESTRKYEGLYWMLIRNIILDQEKRIFELEKEILKLKIK